MKKGLLFLVLMIVGSMNVLLSAGHDKIRQGAQNDLFNLSEYQLNETVVAMVAEEFYKDDVLKYHKLVVLNHENADDLNSVIRTVNRIHDEFPLKCAVELHFNAATNKNWNGSEVLYGSLTGARFAKIFQEELINTTKEKDRRIYNPIDDYHRLKSKFPDLIEKRDFIKGFLTKTRPVCLILEPAYISHDPTAYKLQEIYFLNDIAQGILNGFRRIIENEMIEESDTSRSVA